MRAAKRMPSIQDLRLFDSCVTLGRVVLPGDFQSLPTVKDLLAMMDRYDIAEALVHDHHARSSYPREDGNHRIVKLTRGHPRLHPVWIIEPPKAPGKGPARKLVAGMLAAGVKAARLPMGKIPPLPWLWTDLFSALEEHRIPCFLDFGNDVSTRGELTDQNVEGVRELALRHPKLPLVFSHIMGGLGVHPAVLPLIRRVPNVHLDITGIIEYWLEAAREVGPERVLFATGAPFTDPGILVSNVQYARGLDAKAKRQICGDNLRRLLEAVR